MSRLSVLPAVLAFALALPTLAQAQPRPEPRRDGPGNNGRPGLPGQPQPGQPANMPGGRRSPHDNDVRFRELQQNKKMNEAERKEFAELEARQKRLDEMKRRDAERDRDRAERIRKAHQEQAARFKAPPSPESLAEYTRYSQRKASLQRAKEIADAEGRADAAARAATILASEEARHAAWVSAHAG